MENRNKKHRYKKEEIEFILTNSDLHIDKLTSEFNKRFKLSVTKNSIYKILKRNGVSRDKRLNLNEEEMNFIRNNFTKMELRSFAKTFNETFSRNASATRLRIIANEMGLKNGTWSTRELLPLGAETVIGGRVKIKVGMPSEWMFKNRYVYENKTGLSCDGLSIIHLDGNPMNCEFENLLAVDRKTLGILAGNCWLGEDRNNIMAKIKCAELICALKESEGQ